MIDTLIDIHPATKSDWPKMKILLEKLGLPTKDVSEDLEGFFVAFQGNLLVGTIGVERFGNLGMLRSLAVNREFRSQNLGSNLYQKAEQYAQDTGIESLYLITIAARHYFGAKGYQEISLEDVPEPVKSTEQFTKITPAEAAIMVKKLN